MALILINEVIFSESFFPVERQIDTQGQIIHLSSSILERPSQSLTQSRDSVSSCEVEEGTDE